MKAPQSEKGMATAYHEAGHAVAAYCLGVGMRYITILENEVSNGHGMIDPEQCNAFLRSLDLYQGDRWHPYRLEAEKWIMVHQAGEVAHRRHKFPGRVRCSHFESDRSVCLEILHKVAPDEEPRDIDAHYRLLCTWTVSLIEQQWPKVEVVAKALLERGTLFWAQIHEVIHGVDEERAKTEAQTAWREVNTIRKRRDEAGRKALDHGGK
jgi:hypothetical protein